MVIKMSPYTSLRHSHLLRRRTTSYLYMTSLCKLGEGVWLFALRQVSDTSFAFDYTYSLAGLL